MKLESGGTGTHGREPHHNREVLWKKLRGGGYPMTPFNADCLKGKFGRKPGRTTIEN